MAGEVTVDALPYIDQGYDDTGVRESVSVFVLSKNPKNVSNLLNNRVVKDFSSKTKIVLLNKLKKIIKNWKIGITSQFIVFIIFQYFISITGLGHGRRRMSPL